MLTFVLNLRPWLGLVAIAICVWAWWVDLAGITYVCPFCRVQRTVIGVLGVMMLLPVHGHWLVRYVSATLGFFGGVVAATQHFGGWARVSAGEFEFHDPLYFDSFLLSGAAIWIISGLVMLLWVRRSARPGAASAAAEGA